ncbi:MAG TPA: FG-GAP-like repeat-containing protein, partial [Gammaproteobacteria bacterium]|nr:FG-GAP-like repeat-containing protein [Gammaproteobacteria bacterium]
SGVVGLPFALAADDFNTDGIVDLAIVGKGDPSILFVRPGNGDGTFGDYDKLYGAGDGTADLQAADINADGALDLVVANSGDGTVGIFTGNSDGTFSVQRTIAVGGSPAELRVGDVTGDGRADIVVRDDGIQAFVSDSDGQFRRGRTYSSGGDGGDSFLLMDSNGDDWPDAVVTNSTNLGIIFHRNPAPTLAGSQFEVTGGDTLSDTLSAVDEFGLELTFAAAAKPEHGAYDVGSDGSFTYTPNAGFAGADSFNVTIDNGHAESTATVDIVVNKPEGPGLSGLADVSAEAGEAIPEQAFSITGTGDLAVTASASNTELLPGSAITISQGCGTDSTDCTLLISPAAGQYGNAEVSVTVTDGYGQSVDAGFTVTIRQSTGDSGDGDDGNEPQPEPEPAPNPNNGGNDSGGGGGFGGFALATLGLLAIIRRRRA